MMYQDIYNCICQNTKNEDILSSMSNLQPNWFLKIDFQKVDQHAGGKWLIHDTRRRKDNQLQSLELPCRISKLSSTVWHKGESKTQLVNQRKQNSYRRAYIYIYINTELLDGNKGHQEETHHPTHRFQRLELDTYIISESSDKKSVKQQSDLTIYFSSHGLCSMKNIFLKKKCNSSNIGKTSSSLLEYDFDSNRYNINHEGIIKWKHFPRCWPFV